MISKSLKDIKRYEQTLKDHKRSMDFTAQTDQNVPSGGMVTVASEATNVAVRLLLLDQA